MSLNRILVADDEESMRWVLSKALKRKGYTVDLAHDGRQALALIQDNSYDLAILDIKMPGISGLDLLDRVRELKSDLLVVIMTAEASMKNAVEAMKRGAYDYITKPFDLDVIDAILEKVERAREIAGQVSMLKHELKDRYQVEKNIIGNSPAMREVYKTIGKVAGSDVTVLIQGESGTGKELVARAIHFNSGRLGKPFVAINCAAIPRDLLESELFGSEKGAYTGATERKQGNRRHAAGFAGQDTARPPGTGSEQGRRQPEYPGGCAHRGRHQSGSGGKGPREGVSRGPVLPSERGADYPGAAAGAQGGYSGSGPVLPGTHLHGTLHPAQASFG